MLIARSVVAFVLFAAAVPSLAQTAATRAARRVQTKQQQAWNRADIDAFMKGY